MAVNVTAADLAAYVNNPDIDTTRATTLIGYATTLCLSVVSPLPDGAEIVVLDVAERAFFNPTAAQNEGLGFFNDEGQATRGGGGLYLTRENKATLRRLNGSGGAFTIDTAPATAGQGLPWWDTGTSLPSDFDVPPTA